MGTCFIVKEKGDCYLVTNYHLLAGREPDDTTKIINEFGLIPNTLVAFFDSKYENQNIRCAYNILSEDGTRLFYTNKPYFNSKSICDIAIFKIDSIPENAVIEPIDISKIKSFIINPNSNLYIYGYRGLVDFNRKYPIEDTVTSAIDRLFTYKDSVIIANWKIDLHGGSGSPIYFDINGERQLVAMASQENAKPLNGLPFYKFITIGEIKRTIDESITSGFFNR